VKRYKRKRVVWEWPAHQVSAAGAPRITAAERRELKGRQLSWLGPSPDVTPEGKRVVR
jgi:hypothetical protein